AIGVKTRIPAFFIFSVCLIRPLAFEALVRPLSCARLIRTWMPLTAVPPWVTWILSPVLRPTNSCFGVTLLTATQGVGGVGVPTTSTVAVALLLPLFVSGLSPPTVTVFVCTPTALGLVTRVIVTDSPTAIGPIVQLRI